MIRKRFIGEDGSLGYKHGRKYWLREHYSPNYPIVISRFNILGSIAKVLLGSGLTLGYCPYSSLEKFNENWENV